MSDKSQTTDDPFFTLPENSEWNACIGKQGEELNYIDGYIDAAIVLAETIIQKKLYGQRDTLVLPILYNARHAVELCQKFLIDTLNAAGVLSEARPTNHDIKAHWSLLNAAGVGDECLRRHIADLKPFIESLAQVDDDGQSLRYHLRQDGTQAMADRGLANIAVITLALHNLKPLLEEIKIRAIELKDEMGTGTYTKLCSRRDLLEIASLLPPYSEWGSQAFDLSKAEICARFGLSGRQFSLALDKWKTCREMAAMLGIETSLLHLRDEDVAFAVQQWRRKHPADRRVNPLGTELSDITSEELQAHRAVTANIQKTMKERFSAEAIAELQQLFYLGRDHGFCEYYEDRVGSAIRSFAYDASLDQALYSLLSKTNFKDSLAKAARLIGRRKLAETLEGL